MAAGPARTRLLTAAIEKLARAAGTAVVNPLLEHGFVASLSSAGGRLGYGNRREAVAALFAEVIPAPVLERRDKARFGQAFWNEQTRALTRSWAGGILDERLVDREVLRAFWAAPEPPLQTALLVQQLWLSTSAV